MKRKLPPSLKRGTQEKKRDLLFNFKNIGDIKSVMMISGHRQWRAWQFGRRHSGLFRGGASTNGTDGDEGNKWTAVIVLAYFGLLLLFWFVWPQAAAYMLAGAILMSILGWVLTIFF